MVLRNMIGHLNDVELTGVSLLDDYEEDVYHMYINCRVNGNRKQIVSIIPKKIVDEYVK